MTFPDTLLQRPQIRLAGPVNNAMLELTTAGGEADIGRRIAQNIQIQIERADADL